MPSKLKTQHHRDKIRASVLMDRLQKHAEGKLDMTPSQIRAADILLKKTVPDLSAVKHQWDDNSGPMKVDVTVRIVKPGP